MVRIAGDLVHSQADTWGITEVFIIWQDRLLLRIGANHGAIGFGIAESLGQVGHNLNHHTYYGRELQDRRLWYEHVGQSVMTRMSHGKPNSLFL